MRVIPEQIAARLAAKVSHPQAIAFCVKAKPVPYLHTPAAYRVSHAHRVKTYQPWRSFCFLYHWTYSQNLFDYMSSDIGIVKYFSKAEN
jgi:hypothetical protein